MCSRSVSLRCCPYYLFYLPLLLLKIWVGKHNGFCQLRIHCVYMNVVLFYIYAKIEILLYSEKFPYDKVFRKELLETSPRRKPCKKSTVNTVLIMLPP